MHVRQTRFSAFEHINQALWEGKLLNSNYPTVRITIVGGEDGPALVIDVWNSPKKYHIFATDSLDVYVAVEIRVNPEATLD